jgi:hypothetical protein
LDVEAASDLLSCDLAVMQRLMIAKHRPPIVWSQFFEIRTLIEWASHHARLIWGDKTGNRKWHRERTRLLTVQLDGLDVSGPPPAPSLPRLLEQMEGCRMSADDYHNVAKKQPNQRMPYLSAREDDRHEARLNLRGRPWLMDPDRYRLSLFR